MVNLDLGKPWKTFSSFVRKAMGFYKSTYIVCPNSEHQLAMSNQIWTGLWTTLFANPSFSQGPHSPLSTAFNLQQDRYRFPAVKLRRKPTACFLPNPWTVKHFHHVSSHASHASATSASNLRQPGLMTYQVRRPKTFIRCNFQKSWVRGFGHFHHQKPCWRSQDTLQDPMGWECEAILPRSCGDSATPFEALGPSLLAISSWA